MNISMPLIIEIYTDLGMVQVEPETMQIHAEIHKCARRLK